MMPMELFETTTSEAARDFYVLHSIMVYFILIVTTLLFP